MEEIQRRLQDEPVIKDLVSKCGGLPKVIVAIAHSIGKHSVRWMERASSINGNFIQELKNSRDFISLSGLFCWMDSYFSKCPDYIKPCILYLPVFPPGLPIRRRRLVRRWIAEGYSRDDHEKCAEENGERQVSELADLSIVQPPSALGSGGNTRMYSCLVNGFFREYIVSSQTEDNLVFESSGKCSLTTRRTGRHLVISKNWIRDQVVYESTDFSRLRSLTVFGEWQSFFISEDMRLLRVLDLEDAEGTISYGDLKLLVKRLDRLKFLSLRGHKSISRLPNSVGTLRQLQTLDIRDTSIVTLPVNITRLQKLQYLRAGPGHDTDGNTSTPATEEEEGPSGSAAPTCLGRHSVSRLSNYCRGRHHQVDGVEIPPGLGTLTALHTLGVIDVSASGTKTALQQLKKLTQLRKLGVSGINMANSKMVFDIISKLAHLESLSVFLDKDSQSCLDGTEPPAAEGLRSLKLHGLKDRLPKWSFGKLVKLDVQMAELNQSEIDILGELPELCILRLRFNDIIAVADEDEDRGQEQDKELRFRIMANKQEVDSFLKVRILEIACGKRVTVTFGSKTMLNLEQLKVDCSKATPELEELDGLPALKEVILKGSSVQTLTGLQEKLDSSHPNNPRVV